MPDAGPIGASGQGFSVLLRAGSGRVSATLLGDEQHVVFECPGLQDIRDRHLGLFGEHAATMIQFMWQDDIRGVAMYIKECLGVYYGNDPDGGQASDQP